VSEPSHHLLMRASRLRRVLKTLEDLDLVERERNFDAPATAPFRHRIADNAVRAWYSFVEPNRGRLVIDEAAEVWRHRVEPHLDAYMSLAFERLVEQAFRRHHTAWGMPAARTRGRWEGQDRNRRSIEIDIVARLDDGRLLTGEVKWSSRPVDLDIHRDLPRDLEDLARSGQGWARDTLHPERSVGHLYISAAGFTDAFQQQAARDRRLITRSLDDLYAG
jgi:AAA+ ATPase superfamily predicted ATPase